MAMRTFTVNGTKSDTWGMLFSLTRPLNPNISLKPIVAPKKEGAYISPYNFRQVDPREFSVTLFIEGTDYNNLRLKMRTLANFFRNLNRDGLAKPFKFSDDIVTFDVFYQGDGAWEEYPDGKTALATLNFFVPQAEGYDATQKTANFVSGSVSYTHNGTTETSPFITYTFNASQSSIKFTHTPSGKFILLTKAFVSGNIINIDFDRGTIYDGTGVSLMPYLDITSRWFEFAPGESSTITVDKTTYSSAQLRWYDRYI